MVTSITGKIIEVMLPRTGTSKNGNEWVSQDFVIEEESGDKLVFNVFGQNKLDEYGLKVGTTAAVTVKVESRKWNDKYFTQATCVSCISNSQPTQQVPTPQPVSTPNLDRAREVVNNSAPVSATDLPF